MLGGCSAHVDLLSEQFRVEVSSSGKHLFWLFVYTETGGAAMRARAYLFPLRWRKSSAIHQHRTPT